MLKTIIKVTAAVVAPTLIASTIVLSTVAVMEYRHYRKQADDDLAKHADRRSN